MERFTDILGPDVATWPQLIKHVEKPSFRLATHLGSGENSDVYALGPRCEDVWYTDSDNSDDSSDDSSDHDSSDHGDHDNSDDNIDDENSSDGSRGSSEASECCSNGSNCCSGSEGAGSECTGSECGDSGKARASKVVVDEHVRVFSNLPSIGKTQLVAKVFDHLEDDTCFAVWDTCNDVLVQYFQNELDADDYIRQYLRNEQAHAPPRGEGNGEGDGDAATANHYVCRLLPSVYCCDGVNAGFNAFVNESLCHLLLSELVHTQLTLHVTVAQEAVQHKNTGYLLMERLSCTLDDLIYKVCTSERRRPSSSSSSDVDEDEDALHDFPPVDRQGIAALLFQTMFGLTVLQKTSNMKHHDFHTNNVFIKHVDDDTIFRSAPLKECQYFHYHLDGDDFYVPNGGLLAKIGDFGMTSLDLHSKRLHRTDIATFNDNIEKWGIWNKDFDGEEGYDMQLLSADIPVTCRAAVKKVAKSERAAKSKSKKGSASTLAASVVMSTTESLIQFFEQLQAVCGACKTNVTRHKRRPAPGCVSTRLTSDLLRSMFTGDSVHSWYDFRQPPPSSCSVVCLGDTRWLDAKINDGAMQS